MTRDKQGRPLFAARPELLALLAERSHLIFGGPDVWARHLDGSGDFSARVAELERKIAAEVTQAAFDAGIRL